MGEKGGEDGIAGEEGGEERTGGEVGAGDGDKGSEREGAGLVATVRGDGSGLDGLSTSFSSSSFLFNRVGEVGTPGLDTSAALCEGEDLMGPGVTMGLLVEDEAAKWRLGITVKEFRDWRRRFARARAWVSPSGIWARSGFGAGRISNSCEEQVTLDETGLKGASARARRVSGEHGTLGLGGTSAASQSLSLVGLFVPLSGSSLGVTAALWWTPLSSKR